MDGWMKRLVDAVKARYAGVSFNMLVHGVLQIGPFEIVEVYDGSYSGLSVGFHESPDDAILDNASIEQVEHFLGKMCDSRIFLIHARMRRLALCAVEDLNMDATDEEFANCITRLAYRLEG